jgi:hypothetical protein
MKKIIKFSELDIDNKEFNIIKSDLEKLIALKPSEDIIKFSNKVNWTIDQKDITVIKGNPISYRVEFYHNEIEGERKKCYMGSLSYNSPVELNK